ncbi:hypothetical protein Tco_0378477 [Tanacetum coccineum]
MDELSIVISIIKWVLISNLLRVMVSQKYGFTSDVQKLRQLQLADASGINMLQNEEIFAGLQNIGSKSGGWDQFGSNIATALICQPQPSAAPTLSQPVPTPTPSVVQIPTPPLTPIPPSTQPPPLTQPVQSTTPPHYNIKSIADNEDIRLEIVGRHRTKRSEELWMKRMQRGSQAPPGSKIYKRKPKSTTTPTKVLDFEEPAESQVNTGSAPSAQDNTAQVNTESKEGEGKDPMTEEDLQAEFQSFKETREQELQGSSAGFRGSSKN